MTNVINPRNTLPFRQINDFFLVSRVPGLDNKLFLSDDLVVRLYCERRFGAHRIRYPAKQSRRSVMTREETSKFRASRIQENQYVFAGH